MMPEMPLTEWTERTSMAKDSSSSTQVSIRVVNDYILEEGRGRRGPSPNDKCWNCQKSGHW